MVDASIAGLFGAATWAILFALKYDDEVLNRFIAGAAVFVAVLQWRLFG